MCKRTYCLFSPRTLPTLLKELPVKQSLATCLDDVRRTQAGLELEMKACLALSRATLQTLAALSTELNAAAHEALEQEARRADKGVQAIVEELAERLQSGPRANRTVQLLQQGLIEAAAALPVTPREDGLGPAGRAVAR